MRELELERSDARRAERRSRSRPRRRGAARTAPEPPDAARSSRCCGRSARNRRRRPGPDLDATLVRARARRVGVGARGTVRGAELRRAVARRAELGDVLVAARAQRALGLGRARRLRVELERVAHVGVFVCVRTRTAHLSTN